MTSCGHDAVLVSLHSRADGKGMLSVYSVSKGIAAPKLESSYELPRVARCIAFSYVAVGIAAIPEGAIFYGNGSCDVCRLRLYSEYAIEGFGENDDASRLIGHQRGAVTALACSGQTLYSAGTDMTVRLWDAAQGIQLAVVAQDVDPPSCISVLADSTRDVLMAGFSAAGFVSMWRTPMLFASTSGLREWCISPLMAAAVGTCGIWNKRRVTAAAAAAAARSEDSSSIRGEGIRTALECHHTFPLGLNRVHTAILLPGGLAAISASHTGEVQCWDTANLCEVASWQYGPLFGHEQPVTALAMIGDSIIVTASDDRTLRVARCPTPYEARMRQSSDEPALSSEGVATTPMPMDTQLFPNGHAHAPTVADVLSGVEEAAHALERGGY